MWSLSRNWLAAERMATRYLAERQTCLEPASTTECSPTRSSSQALTPASMTSKHKPSIPHQIADMLSLIFLIVNITIEGSRCESNLPLAGLQASAPNVVHPAAGEAMKALGISGRRTSPEVSTTRSPPDHVRTIHATAESPSTPGSRALRSKSIHMAITTSLTNDCHRRQLCRHAIELPKSTRSHDR